MKKGRKTFVLVESNTQVVQKKLIILVKALLKPIKGRGEFIVGGGFGNKVDEMLISQVILE